VIKEKRGAFAEGPGEKSPFVFISDCGYKVVMALPFENIESSHADFLRDESRKTGRADAIVFPVSEQDVLDVLARARSQKLAVTLQGGRTGITAGAVPDGGLVINLSRMKCLTGLRHDTASDTFHLSVQPGVLLADLRLAVAKKEFSTDGWSAGALSTLERFKAAGRYFFPPDPTETTASVGGMVACNASGARTFRYGPTRKYISGLRVILANGSIVALRRGEHRIAGREFSLGPLQGTLPRYTMPAVKNASGYFAADNMDLVDLFIGSEGTLGVVTEAELVLLPGPVFEWGVTAFLPDAARAVEFVRRVRGEPDTLPVAIEFFDVHALDLLSRQRKVHAAFAELPEPPAGSACAVYMEFHGDDEDRLMVAIETLSGLIVACGGNEGATWTAMEPREMKRLHDFRHAIPEAVNLLIDERRKAEPGIAKLGTDMAVPDERLEDVMALYRRALGASGLEYVMFGHIGDNHIHVNILPRNLDEYETGQRLYLDWAREIIGMGGTVSAEHGIGKLKVALLREMYGDTGVEEMKAVKRVFDPEWRLNRGNLFDPER
jgi:D-lactate dehydrogenase (cytochrome)